MSKSRPAAKRVRAEHPSQGIAVSVQIALAGLVFLAIMFYRAGTTTSVGSGSGTGITSSGKPLASCGLAGQPACQIAVDWVPVTSELPGDVATDIAHDKMFLSVASHYGHLSLDLPALVHTFGAKTGSDYFLDDHWVVSVRDTTGKESLLFDFVYDRAHQRMRFSGYGVLTPTDPQYGHVFPSMQASAALADLKGARGVLPMASRAPELIFFPIAGGYIGPQATHHWSAGGESPLNPMWRIVGANGLSYFVGPNQHVYLQQDLPIA